MVNISRRRKISLMWVILILVSAIVIILASYFICYVWHNLIYLWITITINVALVFGIFISFYAIPFCFEKSHYPFVTNQEEKYFFHWWQKALFHWITWLFIIPIILAVVPVLIYLVIVSTSVFTNSNDVIPSIIVFLIISLLGITNNISYLFIIKKIKINNEYYFDTKK